MWKYEWVYVSYVSILIYTHTFTFLVVIEKNCHLTRKHTRHIHYYIISRQCIYVKGHIWSVEFNIGGGWKIGTSVTPGTFERKLQRSVTIMRDGHFYTFWVKQDLYLFCIWYVLTPLPMQARKEICTCVYIFKIRKLEEINLKTET